MEKTLAPQSDSEDDDLGPEGGENPPDWPIGSHHMVQSDEYYSDPTPAQSFAQLSAFIKRKRLGSFFPDDWTIHSYAERAVRMYKGLKKSGCSLAIANDLTLLTLYDLVIFVGEPLVFYSCVDILLAEQTALMPWYIPRVAPM